MKRSKNQQNQTRLIANFGGIKERLSINELHNTRIEICENGRHIGRYQMSSLVKKIR